jgi:hypothetical protein
VTCYCIDELACERYGIVDLTETFVVHTADDAGSLWSNDLSSIRVQRKEGG